MSVAYLGRLVGCSSVVVVVFVVVCVCVLLSVFCCLCSLGGMSWSLCVLFGIYLGAFRIRKKGLLQYASLLSLLS